MNELLSKCRWTLALRGVIAILFGVLALIWPALTLVALVALFAAYALLGGIVSVIGAIKHRTADSKWWLLLLLGVVGIVAGLITLANPGLTALVLILIIGANALVTGVLDLVLAVQWRRSGKHIGLLVLSGIVSILFGGLVLAYPGSGALAMIWLISFYAILTGILLLTLALQIRRWKTTSTSEAPKTLPV